MSDTPRTAPCPCGSGKKYKNCCERLETAKLGRLRMVRDAVPRATDWLVARYSRQVQDAIDEDYLGALGEDERARLSEMPRAMAEMLSINAMEWLLAEGELVPEADGEPRSALELVLGPGGPLLSAEQREFLAQLARRPLRPYEVLESRPNEGLLLHDLLVEAEPPVWVNERSGSRQLVQWDVLGARVLAVGSGHILSGAVYPFAVDERLDIVEDIRRESYRGLRNRANAGRAAPDDTVARLTIVGCWLANITAPPPELALRDAGTRDPLMLVTDRYEVLDWDALARGLEAEPDVEGNRKRGWTRFETIDQDRTRSLLAINIAKERDRIEPFARTMKLADRGREWLERIAGGAIHHLSRDVVDPQDVLRERGSEPAESRAAPKAEPVLSPADATRLSQQFHEQSYRDWADKPVPALDDRTPREAVESAEGRAEVVALLKLYESSEQRTARQEGRAPADLEFLWKQVGLDRERVLAELLVR
jgi:hypothetical protein